MLGAILDLCQELGCELQLTFASHDPNDPSLWHEWRIRSSRVGESNDCMLETLDACLSDCKRRLEGIKARRAA